MELDKHVALIANKQFVSDIDITSLQYIRRFLSATWRCRNHKAN